MSFFPLLLTLGAAFLAPAGGNNPNPFFESGAVLERVAGSGGAASMLSQYRQQNGLGAVVADGALERAAQFQADAMARSDQLSHDVAGSTSSRLDAAGIRWRAYAENVSMATTTAAGVIGRWQRSPSHNHNLLNSSIRRIGIAAARSSTGRMYWAMVMTD